MVRRRNVQPRTMRATKRAFFAAADRNVRGRTCTFVYNILCICAYNVLLLLLYNARAREEKRWIKKKKKNRTVRPRVHKRAVWPGAIMIAN